jgi:hypothetical protein
MLSNLLLGNNSFTAVVTETSVYLAAAHQQMSGSGSTIPAFRYCTLTYCMNYFFNMVKLQLTIY